MNGAACSHGNSIACNMYSKRQGSHATFDATDTTITITTTIIYSSTNDDTKEKKKIVHYTTRRSTTTIN